MSVQLLAAALEEAKATAYKGVVRPVEGTILTVIKDIAAQAEASVQRTDSFTEVLADIVEAADASVQRTPDLLPILKQAGVVDSGGKGLLCIFEGMWRFINGDPLDKPIAEVLPLSEMNLDNAMETVEPGQDYEVVIDFKPEDGFNLEKYYEASKTLALQSRLVKATVCTGCTSTCPPKTVTHPLITPWGWHDPKSRY